MAEVNDNGSIQLFEDQKIRTAWDAEKEEWYFSIIDVISVLTGTANPRRYWSDLKRKLKAEGANELYEKIVQLKMLSSDGKRYKTDVANTEQLGLALGAAGEHGHRLVGCGLCAQRGHLVLDAAGVRRLAGDVLPGHVGVGRPGTQQRLKEGQSDFDGFHGSSLLLIRSVTMMYFGYCVGICRVWLTMLRKTGTLDSPSVFTQSSAVPQAAISSEAAR